MSNTHILEVSNQWSDRDRCSVQPDRKTRPKQQAEAVSRVDKAIQMMLSIRKCHVLSSEGLAVARSVRWCAQTATRVMTYMFDIPANTTADVNYLSKENVRASIIPRRFREKQDECTRMLIDLFCDLLERYTKHAFTTQTGHSAVLNVFGRTGSASRADVPRNFLPVPPESVDWKAAENDCERHRSVFTKDFAGQHHVFLSDVARPLRYLIPVVLLECLQISPCPVRFTEVLSRALDSYETLLLNIHFAAATTLNHANRHSLLYSVRQKSLEEQEQNASTEIRKRREAFTLRCRTGKEDKKEKTVDIRSSEISEVNFPHRTKRMHEVAEKKGSLRWPPVPKEEFQLMIRGRIRWLLEVIRDSTPSDPVAQTYLDWYFNQSPRCYASELVFIMIPEPAEISNVSKCEYENKVCRAITRFVFDTISRWSIVAFDLHSPSCKSLTKMESLQESWLPGASFRLNFECDKDPTRVKQFGKVFFDLICALKKVPDGKRVSFLEEFEAALSERKEEKQFEEKKAARGFGNWAHETFLIAKDKPFKSLLQKLIGGCTHACENECTDPTHTELSHALFRRLFDENKTTHSGVLTASRYIAFWLCQSRFEKCIQKEETTKPAVVGVTEEKAKPIVVAVDPLAKYLDDQRQTIAAVSILPSTKRKRCGDHDEEQDSYEVSLDARAKR